MISYFHTFGCKLNFAETASIAQSLSEIGIRAAQKDEIPDIVVVNTCSVTEEADSKCRRAIRSFNKRWPQASIIVTGCYAKIKADEAASLPGVKLVAGSDRKMDIVKFVDRMMAEESPIVEACSWIDIREFRSSCSRGDRTRFFLKVQDGCDYHCSYCTIPLARGRSRSGTIDGLVELAHKAAEDGGKEIVITGVNIGTFGMDTGENFLDLLKALDDVEGIERYRISSIEPNLLTEEILQWIAS